MICILINHVIIIIQRPKFALENPKKKSAYNAHVEFNSLKNYPLLILI